MADADDLVECRLCGQRWRSLGHHLRWGHGLSADDYRDRFGIRRGQPLTSPTTRARFSANLTATIGEGKLDAHFAGNPARAAEAGSAGRSAKRALRAAGVAFPHGTAPTARDRIEAIVAAIEAGTPVATAVKRAGLSTSGYHASLIRHPDLKARHDAVRPKGGPRLINA